MPTLPTTRAVAEHGLNHAVAHRDPPITWRAYAVVIDSSHEHELPTLRGQAGLAAHCRRWSQPRRAPGPPAPVQEPATPTTLPADTRWHRSPCCGLLGW